MRRWMMLWMLLAAPCGAGEIDLLFARPAAGGVTPVTEVLVPYGTTPLTFGVWAHGTEPEAVWRLDLRVLVTAGALERRYCSFAAAPPWVDFYTHLCPPPPRALAVTRHWLPNPNAALPYGDGWDYVGDFRYDGPPLAPGRYTIAIAPGAPWPAGCGTALLNRDHVNVMGAGGTVTVHVLAPQTLLER